VTPWDDRACALGEGALWHPGRGQLYWFDITAGRLHTREDGAPRTYEIGEMASAAGWIDRNTLLIATETALRTLDLATGALARLHDLEAGNPATRSNDGRADPWGGFWIGTMGKEGEEGAGAIYRLHRGELRRLHGRITIPNAICFAPGAPLAYWTDTPTQVVMRQPLDPETGWPAGEPEPHLDLSGTSRRPDGAVTDAAGNLWIAEYGGGRVTCSASDGALLSVHEVGGAHSTCPAFGGPDLTTLFVTTARQGLSGERLADPAQGCTFAIPNAGRGRPEPRVIL
jgi:sugar lactone lactonase YvrE